MISKKLILLFLLCLTLGSIDLYAQDLSKIVNISVECKDEKIRNDAFDFFQQNLKPNMSKKDITNIVKRFYFQLPIKNISIEYDEENHIFRIHIVPQSNVNEYVVTGNKMIKKEDIIRELSIDQSLYQGDDLIAELQSKTKDYYTYRGFPQANIEIESVPQKESGVTKVFVKIQENEPCYINDLEFLGETNPNWIKRIRKEFLWDKKPRCDLERITEQNKSLREHYNKRYYYQFDIGNTHLKYTDDTKLRAHLTANLFVGKRISVQFNGNRYSFERDELLSRAIYLDLEKKFNQGFENTALAGIKTFYENHGYIYSKVQFREKDSYGLRELIFDIDRGPVVRLGDVKFQGNIDISTERLKHQFELLAPMWTRRNYWVSGDMPVIVNGFLSFYQSMGYLHTYFFEPLVDIQKRNHRANVTFKLHEGAASFFDEFNVQDNVFMSSAEVKKFFDVKKGDPIDPIKMRDAAQKLEYEYQTKGFKYIKVKLPEIESIEEGLNSYNVQVLEGPRIHIGDIILQGNYSTHDYVITRELTIKTGDLLNPEEIRESRRKLLRLGFFKSILIEEKVRDDLQDIEDVVINVVESKKRSLVVRPGISTDDGGRLTSTLSYNNILGTGRNASLSGSVNHRFNSDAILEHRILATYLEPKIFNFMDGKINIIDERQEWPGFDLSQQTFIIGVEKNFSSWLRTTLQWVLEYRDPFNVDPSIVLSDLDESRARFGSLSTIIDFDFRDNLLNASRGSFHRIQFDYYNRAFLSDADFYQFYIRNTFFFPIYHRFRSVLSVRAGVSGTTGQTKAQGIDQIPIEKRFRLGGSSSLRGFDLNCVGGLPKNVPENCSSGVLSGATQSFLAPGGNSVINYLWDFLIPVTSTLDLALFTDGGNAFLTNSQLDVLDIRTTAGFGIRYNTVVGPLRLDYGIKLDRRTGESFGEIHFAVGQF